MHTVVVCLCTLHVVNSQYFYKSVHGTNTFECEERRARCRSTRIVTIVQHPSTSVHNLQYSISLFAAETSRAARANAEGGHGPAFNFVRVRSFGKQIEPAPYARTVKMVHARIFARNSALLFIAQLTTMASFSSINASHNGTKDQIHF